MYNPTADTTLIIITGAGIMKTDENNKITYLLNRLKEKLWFKPLIIGFISIMAVMISKLADLKGLWGFTPNISPASLDKLLSIMASSMMVVATFSVGSMLSAYASAGRSASPRSFRLLVADDSSQHALSAFVGAFIFSIVGLVAVDNKVFGPNGIFVLFVFTMLVFTIVVLIFVRWTDRIARLGRMSNTLEKVEAATARALGCYARDPLHNANPLKTDFPYNLTISSHETGYVQHIDLVELQKWAEQTGAEVEVKVLPGSYVSPAHTLGRVYSNEENKTGEKDLTKAIGAFKIGKERMYDDDPRFGLVVLSQIAGRALSPAVNDPGTAIDVIGIQVRLLARWASQRNQNKQTEQKKQAHNRIYMPELSVNDMFDDAFTAIARDGSGYAEVVVRLLKGLAVLKALGNPNFGTAAEHIAQKAFYQAKHNLYLDEDIHRVRRLSDLDQL